jgi:hypothetical protein
MGAMALLIGAMAPAMVAGCAHAAAAPLPAATGEGPVGTSITVIAVETFRAQAPCPDDFARDVTQSTMACLRQKGWMVVEADKHSPPPAGAATLRAKLAIRTGTTWAGRLRTVGATLSVEVIDSRSGTTLVSLVIDQEGGRRRASRFRSVAQIHPWMKMPYPPRSPVR